MHPNHLFFPSIRTTTSKNWMETEKNTFFLIIEGAAAEK